MIRDATERDYGMDCYIELDDKETAKRRIALW
jgi:hypothetical protein